MILQTGTYGQHTLDSVGYNKIKEDLKLEVILGRGEEGVGRRKYGMSIVKGNFMHI